MIDAVLYVLSGLVMLIVGIGGGVCSGVMFLRVRAIDDEIARMCLGFLALCGFAMSVVGALYGISLVIAGVLPGV